MYDSEKGLFCHRLRKTSEGLKREGISQRYTVMTLLGLREWLGLLGGDERRR